MIGKTILIFVLATLLSGCTTYKSIQATAFLAQSLPSNASINQMTPTCLAITDALNKANINNPQDCAQAYKTQAQLQNLSMAIAAYGAELNKIVGQKQDLDYPSELQSITKSFSNLQWNQLANNSTAQGQFMGAIVELGKLIIDAAIKKELDPLITKADDIFQKLKSDFNDQAQNLSNNYDNVNAQLDDQIRYINSTNNCPAFKDPSHPLCNEICGAGNQNLMTACTDFRTISVTSTTNKFNQDLIAYIDAHHQIASAIKNTWSDSETYQKLLLAVKAVYDTAK